MYKIYYVQYGETIEDIARKNIITVDKLRKTNNLGMDYEVRAGEQLVVPTDSQQLFDTYIVIQGDTLYDIASKYNVTVDNLALLNGLDKQDYIYPGQEILVPKSDVKFYITNPGDTLVSTADILETNVEELIAQNKIIYLLPEQLLTYKKEK